MVLSYLTDLANSLRKIVSKSSLIGFIIGNNANFSDIFNKDALGSGLAFLLLRI